MTTRFYDALHEALADEVRAQLAREERDRADEARLGVPRGSIARDGDPAARMVYPTPPCVVAAPPDALAATEARALAAEAAARGAAFREREAANEAAMLRGQVAALTARVVDAEAEAARRTDEVVAIGAALGREGATAGECVRLIGRLTNDLDAATMCMESARGALDDVADALGMPAEWDAEWGDRVRAALARPTMEPHP